MEKERIPMVGFVIILSFINFVAMVIMMWTYFVGI